MKNSKRTIASLLFFMLFILGCTRDNDLREAIPLTLVQDGWKIKALDSSGNGTTQYDIYTFDFRPNGELQVSSPNSIDKGQWKLLQKAITPALHISFGSGTPALNGLQHEWDLRLIAGQELELRNNNGILLLKK